MRQIEIKAWDGESWNVLESHEAREERLPWADRGIDLAKVAEVKADREWVNRLMGVES